MVTTLNAKTNEGNSPFRFTDRALSNSVVPESTNPTATIANEAKINPCLLCIMKKPPSANAVSTKFRP